MVAHQYPVEKIRTVLRRMSGSVSAADTFTLHEHLDSTSNRGKSGFALIVLPQFVVGTLMLWVAYFMGLVIFYGLVNWLPLLLKETGVPTQSATMIAAIAALFPLGGIGAVYSGWLMDRYNANVVVGLGYVLTAIFVYLIGQSAGVILIFDGLCRWCNHEHSSIFSARVSRRLLPNAGPRLGCLLDVGHRPLRWYCGFLPRRGIDPPATRPCQHFSLGGGSGADRGRCANDEAAFSST